MTIEEYIKSKEKFRGCTRLSSTRYRTYNKKRGQHPLKGAVLFI